MECFLYVITNTVTGRRYIGSCVKVKRRFGEHRSALKHNKHHCTYLQNSYNKHGKENFTFSIIRALETNDRKIRASAELEEIAKAPCFNSLLAQTNLQFFTSSEAVKLKISNSGKKRYQDNPDIAKSHSEKIKAHYANPENRRKHSEIMKAVHSGETSKLKSEAATLSWKNPEVRKKRIIRNYTEESIQSRKAKIIAFWSSPEGLACKERKRKAQKEYWAKWAERKNALPPP